MNVASSTALLSRAGSWRRAAAYQRFVNENSLILSAAAGYVVAGFLAGELLDWGPEMRPYFTFGALNRFALVFFILFFVGQFLARASWLRLGFNGLADIGTDIFRTYLRPEAVAGFAVVYAAIPPFMGTFSRLKQSIPLYHPFSWDQSFAELDRALHFGHDPWTLLHPMMASPAVTVVIDDLYMAWFGLLFCTALWMSWTSRRRLRARFLISFVAMWTVLGTIMAAAFSSAGPCYYELVTGSQGSFAPLLAYLSDVHAVEPLWSVQAQHGLREALASGEYMPMGGISAMPSMHVAAAVLFALVGWQVNRALGVALIVYAVIVQLGSVHLGWHYAIDGYVSAVVTVAIWHLAGRFVDKSSWFESREPELSR